MLRFIAPTNENAEVLTQFKDTQTLTKVNVTLTKQSGGPFRVYI